MVRSLQISSLLLIAFIIGFGEAVVSEITCKIYDKNEPNYRSCVLTNVCYINRKWTFFNENGNQRFDDQLPVNSGTYDSSPKFNIEQVVLQLPFITVKVQVELVGKPNLQWIKGTTFLYAAYSRLYWHWLMDDLLGIASILVNSENSGLWWLMEENQQLKDDSYLNNNIILLNSDRSPHNHMLEELFSSNPVKLLSEYNTGKRY
jgi:hypothetical protein